MQWVEVSGQSARIERMLVSSGGSYSDYRSVARYYEPVECSLLDERLLLDDRVGLSRRRLVGSARSSSICDKGRGQDA